MLKVAATHLQEIRRHGEEAYPDECCGLLIGLFDGDVHVVQATSRCRNAALDSPRTRYHIDPHELIRAQRQARECGLEIVGFYHSHPDHPAQYSPTDLAEAHWIGCSYMIVAVNGGVAVDLRSFALAGKLEEDKHFVNEGLLFDQGIR